MKVAVVMNSPFLESFALIGPDYLHQPGEDVADDAAMVICDRELELEFTVKYPEKIIIGV